ncbi:type II toxin-antitoxin system VapC family toxin [Arcobacter sp. FWKO B]|uniref:type II toxin-antitoxin system VapC family toxin n=1 Tax=Arcobacter sp. FWKO B TaxID=2593672 RepID=UPI0018A3C60D|nr:type II toxin-antitoxin system VapC family toxin [Arcobacter sp. FWKO B]QOG11846.1 PIN domain-containing protein [Arcobacter sp. FWKO B]
MAYFDTNVLIYAFTKNTDDSKQKDVSIKLIEEAIQNDTLIVSEVVLCEFAFISNKINEYKNDIDNNLEFLATFLQPSHPHITQRMIEILKETNLYMSSFDVYHLAFAEYYNSKLYTFDNGFKKLQNISKIELVIK